MWFPCKMKSKPSLEIVTWSGGSDEQIAAMLEAHYAGAINIYDYWSVGDERAVVLSSIPSFSGQVSAYQPSMVNSLVLTNVGGKYLEDGVTECAFQVDQKLMFPNGEPLSVNNNNYLRNWDTSAIRTWLNETYKNALPETLLSCFKQFKNYTETSNSAYTAGRYVAETKDLFSLRSIAEITGTSTYSNEGSQASYYQTTANRDKGSCIDSNRNNRTGWWYRSMDISQSDGNLSYKYKYSEYNASPNSLYGIAPFGCV